MSQSKAAQNPGIREIAAKYLLSISASMSQCFLPICECVSAMKFEQGTGLRWTESINGGRLSASTCEGAKSPARSMVQLSVSDVGLPYRLTPFESPSLAAFGE